MIDNHQYTGPADEEYNEASDGVEAFHPERLAELADLDGKSAYIVNTAIDKKYMGKHLVGQMMDVLEAALVERGYSYLERDAAVANNYAANIKKTYETNGRLIYAGEPQKANTVGNNSSA